jgi:hypothetical protein
MLFVFSVHNEEWGFFEVRFTLSASNVLSTPSGLNQDEKKDMISNALKYLG